MIGVIDFRNPLFWALMVGWMLTVFLHEFAHGLVAYLGGDYTICERGGLSMNPVHYVDPMMSIVLPALFLAMGGIPLPGGAIYIRRDLLRNRAWEIAVAAAGPAANLLVFFALCFTLTERVGWVDSTVPVARWPLQQTFVAALAFFQLFATLVNLIPIPPLDGFQMIGPLLPRDLERKLLQPGLSMGLLVFFFLIIQGAWFIQALYEVMRPITEFTGVDFSTLVSAARLSLYGRP
jgi:Zn-dependent protease